MASSTLHLARQSSISLMLLISPLHTHELYKMTWYHPIFFPSQIDREQGRRIRRLNYETATNGREAKWSFSLHPTINHVNFQEKLFRFFVMPEYFPFHEFMSDSQNNNRTHWEQYHRKELEVDKAYLKQPWAWAKKHKKTFCGIDECKRNCCGEVRRLHLPRPSDRFLAIVLHALYSVTKLPSNNKSKLMKFLFSLIVSLTRLRNDLIQSLFNFLLNFHYYHFDSFFVFST